MRLRWCAWHELLAPDAVPVRVVEAGLGAGSRWYACRGCVTDLGLVPLNERAESGSTHPAPGLRLAPTRRRPGPGGQRAEKECTVSER